MFHHLPNSAVDCSCFSSLYYCSLQNSNPLTFQNLDPDQCVISLLLWPLLLFNSVFPFLASTKASIHPAVGWSWRDFSMKVILSKPSRGALLCSRLVLTLLRAQCHPFNCSRSTHPYRFKQIRHSPISVRTMFISPQGGGERTRGLEIVLPGRKNADGRRKKFEIQEVFRRLPLAT